MFSARKIIWLVAGLLFLNGSFQGRAAAQGQPKPLVAGQPAPDLVGGGDWLGTDTPLRLKDLRGKIVVLDFWTFC